MGRLHELLAVEKDNRTVLNKIIEETHTTFNKRTAHFTEMSKVYEPLKEGGEKDVEDTRSEMVSTVADKLEYAHKHFSRTIDTMLQREIGNSKAVADWEIDNGDGTKETILKDCPVTFLVTMETTLQRIRDEVYSSIPTLDPSKKWEMDNGRDNVWVAPEQIKPRMSKQHVPIELHKGTDKHPPQVQLVTKDVLVGHYRENVASGALSPKQKSSLLDMIDRLIAGAKIARARANDIEAPKNQVGNKLFNMVMKTIEQVKL